MKRKNSNMAFVDLTSGRRMSFRSDTISVCKILIPLISITILCLFFLIGCHKEEDNNEIIQTCADRLPSWSPDGRYIAFYRDNKDVLINNGFQQSLLSGSSPDEMNDNGDTLKGIRILDLETMDMVFLIKGYAPDWAPNGKEIVYNSSTFGGIWKIDVETNQTQEITNFNGQRPEWSPDGSKITCEVKSIEYSGIYIIDTIGNIRELFAWAVEPNWHPSGDSLIFLGDVGSEYGICIGDTNGNIVRLVREGLVGQAYPEFSPDGSMIVYWFIEDRSIHVMNTLGENDITLTEGYDPSWSSDGQKIVFVGTDTIEHKVSYSLWIMNADGSDKVQITYPDN